MRRPSGQCEIPSATMRSVEARVMSAPSKRDRAVGRPQEPGDRAQGRRLARAVRADQRDQLALRDRQRHALEGADVAVADVACRRAQACARLAEVGGDDVRVGPDGRRVALGDEPAVVQDLDPVAQVHHQRDVVRDEDDRDPQLVAQPTDQPEQLLGLDRVHAGVGLVEQEELRPRADGAGDLEPALVAVRQVAGRAIAPGRPARTARAARAPAASSSRSPRRNTGSRGAWPERASAARAAGARP